MTRSLDSFLLLGSLSMRSHGFRLKLHPQGFKEAELLVRSMRLKQWLWGSVDMDVWQNLLHKHIKQINKCWNFYIEVENGGIQKVTTIGGIHFSLPWLWEEGYHRTNSKQTTWKRFWKLKPGPHEVSTIPIWFPDFRQSSEAIGSNIWPSLATCKDVFPQSCTSLPKGCW